MVATCFFVFMSNYITATISPILVPIIVEFDISVTKATYLITCNILTLGLGVSDEMGLWAQA
jgi:xanthine/uracil permease